MEHVGFGNVGTFMVKSQSTSGSAFSGIYRGRLVFSNLVLYFQEAIDIRSSKLYKKGNIAYVFQMFAFYKVTTDGFSNLVVLITSLVSYWTD